MQGLNRVPLRSLRAVEAVARLGSLALAAREMGVSPGAVSQQIAIAEAALGKPLFVRTPRGMVVTRTAQDMCRLLTDGFSQISRAVGIVEEADDSVLTVSVAPVFASRWLIWRLYRFQNLHPEVKVRVDASIGLVDPRHGDVDLCVRVGRGDWPRVSAKQLFPQIIFPVCAPSMATGLRDVGDLCAVPIIREPNPMFGWQDWLLPGELDPASLPAGPVFSDASLCLDAAISGSGVFLTFETLASDALQNGRVVQPFRRRRATGNAYWLVAADTRLRRPAKLFRAWLLREIAEAGFGVQIA